MLDKSGRPKAEISPDDNSTQTKEIQGDNVLALSFTHHDHITLDVDDRVDYLGERYWLCEKYRPRQKSTREWAYDIKLYGVESLLRNILVIKMVDGEDEPVFTLTAPPREHVAMIVRCLNEGMGDITDWNRHRLFRQILRRGSQGDCREDRDGMVGGWTDRQHMPVRARRAGHSGP